MTGKTDSALKKLIVSRLLIDDDSLRIVICTSVLSMGIDMAGLFYLSCHNVDGLVHCA